METRASKLKKLIDESKLEPESLYNEIVISNDYQDIRQKKVKSIWYCDKITEYVSILAINN